MNSKRSFSESEIRLKFFDFNTGSDTRKSSNIFDSQFRFRVLVSSLFKIEGILTYDCQLKDHYKHKGYSKRHLGTKSITEGFTQINVSSSDYQNHNKIQKRFTVNLL